MRVAGVTLGPLFCHFGRSEQPSLFNLQKLTFLQWVLMILRHYEFEQVDGFWVILGLLCGHFWVTSCSSGPIWIYGVYFGIILIRLQKTHILPTLFKKRCNHTINLGPLWGRLWVTLGLLWVYEALGHLGHFFVILAEVSNRRYSICNFFIFLQWI